MINSGFCQKGHDLSVVGFYEWKDKQTGYVRHRCRTCLRENHKRHQETEKYRQKRDRLHMKYAIVGTPFSTKFSWLKTMGRRRNLEVLLTLQEYENLTRNDLCFYCSSSLPKHGYGVDRLDNKKGYILENCVPCCKQCNEKKGHLEGLGFQYPRTVELMQELVASTEDKNAEAKNQGNRERREEDYQETSVSFATTAV